MKKNINSENKWLTTVNSPEKIALFLNTFLEEGDSQLFLFALYRIVETQAQNDLDQNEHSLKKLLLPKYKLIILEFMELFSSMGLYFSVKVI